VLLDPTVRDIVPATPPVAAPVDNEMLPLEPELEEPVTKERVPLPPAAPEFGVASKKLPLVEAVP
jgi:hypothetical protein